MSVSGCHKSRQTIRNLETCYGLLAGLRGSILQRTVAFLSNDGINGDNGVDC